MNAAHSKWNIFEFFQRNWAPECIYNHNLPPTVCFELLYAPICLYKCYTKATFLSARRYAKIFIQFSCARRNSRLNLPNMRRTNITEYNIIRWLSFVKFGAKMINPKLFTRNLWSRFGDYCFDQGTSNA